MIRWVAVFSRIGKLRLRRWYYTTSLADKSKTVAEVTNLILSRKLNMCNFLEYKGNKIVYRKYASLFFCFCIDADDNELLALEVIHRFVECLDKHYGNVCELDIVYGMSQAYAILDELIVAGEMQESKLKSVNNAILGAHHSELEETLQLNLIGNDK